MNYRILTTYIFMICFFAFLIFAYFNYSKAPTEAYLIENSPERVKQIEEIVKSTIKDNPDLIAASLEAYQAKKVMEANTRMKELIKQNLTVIEENASDPKVSYGNQQPKIKVVEFFDYNCGYCKRLANIKTKIMEENPDVEYIFKEYPILGEQSILAAKYALAVHALDQSKYLPFHLALLNQSQPKTEENLTATAVSVGIKPSALKQALQNPDLNQKILENQNLSRLISIGGTPTYIVAGEMVRIPTYEEISSHIKQARHKPVENPKDTSNNTSDASDDKNTIPDKQ